MSNCLFCAIAAGDVPADKVIETEELVVFRDIDPQAPSHVLAIPKTHYANVGELAAANPNLAGQLLNQLALVGASEGLVEGFRVVFNTGPAGGQTVDHVHAHLLGGRQLTWPPG